MFGFSDLGIGLVYTLCIASGLLCLGYGIMNWNKGAENEIEEFSEEAKWEEKESKIEESL